MQTDSILARALGKQIKSAGSSLNTFALELGDQTALLINAARLEESARLTVACVETANMPKLVDAVCTVDWTWIVGSTIKKATITAERLQLELDPAGPLSIVLGTWQGSPFLGFQPFRPAR